MKSFDFVRMSLECVPSYFGLEVMRCVGRLVWITHVVFIFIVPVCFQRRLSAFPFTADRYLSEALSRSHHHRKPGACDHFLFITSGVSLRSVVVECGREALLRPHRARSGRQLRTHSSHVHAGFVVVFVGRSLGRSEAKQQLEAATRVQVGRSTSFRGQLC